MTNIHIGSIIKQELHKQERSPSWLASKLYCCRTNIYKIFDRKSIDTELLHHISLILNHNFFKYYYDEINDCDFISTKP